MAKSRSSKGFLQPPVEVPNFSDERRQKWLDVSFDGFVGNAANKTYYRLIDPDCGGPRVLSAGAWPLDAAAWPFASGSRPSLPARPDFGLSDSQPKGDPSPAITLAAVAPAPRLNPARHTAVASLS